MKKIYVLLLFTILALDIGYSQNGGYAVKFNGTDGSSSHTLNTGITDDVVTIEFWFTRVSAQAGTKFIADLRSVSDTNNRRVMPYINNGEIGIFCAPNTGDDNNAFTQSSGITAEPNVWYHVTVVLHRDTLKLYINGKRYIFTNMDDNYSLTGTEVLTLGSDYANTTYANIKLDEVRVWNSERTEAQIKANMFKELAGNEASLLAYYKMSNGAGAAISDNQIAGSYDGVLSAGYTWVTSGAFAGCRNALDFDGSNDYVDCGNSASLQRNGTQPFTIEAWVNPVGGVWVAVASKFVHTASNEGYSLEIFTDNKVALLYGNNWSNWNATSSSTSLVPGVWSHIAATYDGSTVKIYINGRLEQSATWTNGLTDSGTNFLIGSRSGTTFFYSQIDEVRFWTIARTEAQIRETMLRTLVGNEAGLNAYYRLDNIDGTLTYDQSPNANTGTLTNMDPNTDWVASGAFNTWLGSESNVWATGSNWSSGAVPAAANSVGIYKWALGNELTISGNPTVNDMFFSSTASPTISSDFLCNANLVLEKNTDLNGRVITLGTSGNLVEGSGRLYGSSGTITTTRNLSNISSLDVGGLGATITTTANMGSTTIIRGHAVQTGNGNNSIQRYYDITPTNNTTLNAILTFNYNEAELNAIPEADLRLYKSADGGTTWTGGAGSATPASNYVTQSSIASFSRWTLGDATHSLAIPIPTPPVATAANMTTTTSFSANWNASATATKYYLDVATNIGFTTFVAGYNNLDVSNVTTYSVSGLTEGATYYYRVRANNAGGTSASSNIITTITIPTAPIATAASSVTTTSFSANWNIFAGATGYYLDVAYDAAFTSFVTGFNNKDVANVTTYSITGLTPGIVYYYRLRSYNGGGTSGNSNIISTFTVPNAPVARAASNVTLTGFTANWNSSFPIDAKVSSLKDKEYSKINTIAMGYYLDVASDPGFTSFLPGYNNKNVGNVNSTNITGLTTGTYYYRVRAFNASGTSINSNIITVPLLVASIISVPTELNFGDALFASESQIKTFTIGNTGNTVLSVDNFLLEGTGGIFEILTPTPVVLEPGTQYNVQVKMNPVKTGSQNVKLHLINNSLTSDVILPLIANIKYPSGLQSLEPYENNFGTSTNDSNNIIGVFTIGNSSGQQIQIIGISIIGDTSSFILLGDNTPSFSMRSINKIDVPSKLLEFSPVTLDPNSTYEIKVKFLPQSIGEKHASLKVVFSNGNTLYSRLYGVAQGTPEITLSMNELNFGELANGSIKTDSIIIRNSGTLNLTINSKILTGTNRSSFIVTGGGELVTLKAGESQVIKITAIGALPVGNRNAELQIASNDPSNPNMTVNLSSLVKNGVIAAVNLIEFDTTDIDEFKDSTITIKNNGNINVTIDKLSFDGAYASDYSIVNTTLPIEINVGEEKNITIRFSPKDVSLRYARLVMHTSDPTVPFTYLVVKGSGIKIQKTFLAKGKVLFNGNPLSGVIMALTGDALSNQTTTETGYSFTLGRMKNYTITPTLLGFTFNPASKIYSNVLNDDEYNFEAINNMPTEIKLVKPENNKSFNMIYPVSTAPIIFGWQKSTDPEGIPVNYKLTITGGGLNKVYSDLTDTLFSADIMKELINSAIYSWYVEVTDGLNVTKSDIYTFKTSISTTDVEKISNTPISYELSQNYPNPFNPETVIKYSIPENCFVTIKVYNTVGKEVAMLVNRNQSAGVYQISWHPNSYGGLPSGVYYYKITAGNFKDVKKMMYVR